MRILSVAQGKLVLELVIFAVLAAVVLFQLYSVLGRRVGRQPEEAAGPVAAPIAARTATTALEGEAVSPTGIDAIRARDPGFDLEHFLSGAVIAYETIVKAFAAGDRPALAKLLSPGVLADFEAAITQREADGRSESVEFLSRPRADLESTDVRGDLARASVRFLAELRSRTRDAAGEAVDDRRTAEIWTFQRDLKIKNPNWTLVRVEAAQA